MFFFSGGAKHGDISWQDGWAFWNSHPFSLKAERHIGLPVVCCTHWQRSILFFFFFVKLLNSRMLTNLLITHIYIYIIYSRMMTTYYWCLSDSLNDDVHQTTLTGAFTAKEQHRSINQDVVRVTTAKRVIRHQWLVHGKWLAVDTLVVK